METSSSSSDRGIVNGTREGEKQNGHKWLLHHHAYSSQDKKDNSMGLRFHMKKCLKRAKYQRCR